MKIYVGKQTPEHKRDTSRELIDMWEECGYCEVVRDEVEDVFIWANEPNDVLLYEYDRFDVYPGLPDTWRKGLFGGMQCNDPRALPWTYWARHPKKLEEKISKGIKSYEQRSVESIFLGKIENTVQRSNRTGDNWYGVIEEFNLPIQIGDSHNWAYTQEEYLERISNSKFGLCLPGYGPKCNREIEYLGLGVVPIISEGVDMTYHETPIEKVHYLRVKNASEIPSIIASTTKEKWKEMSQAGSEWYARNCSKEGSFKTTERILKSL